MESDCKNIVLEAVTADMTASFETQGASVISHH